mmetsp:Transcript_724/g.1745  ORF Transcript_724/g.1745 Transcript_724/m.1745 type:complete len:94 (-) Transcript_724:1692-1973(-)
MCTAKRKKKRRKGKTIHARSGGMYGGRIPQIASWRLNKKPYIHFFPEKIHETSAGLYFDVTQQEEKKEERKEKKTMYARSGRMHEGEAPLPAS